MAEPVVIEVRARDVGGRATLRAVRGELNETGRAAERAGRTGSGGLSRMDVAGQRLRKTLGSVHSTGLRFSAWLGNELSTMARRGALAMGTLVGLVTTFGVRASSNFQQSQLAFETLLGSASKGQALFKQLQTLNLKTPFELGDLTSGAQLLLRYGASADQVIPIVKSLGDIAATSDNPAENFNRLSLAIGQVISQGRLLGQDARQLAEAGFNPYAVLADKLGKTQDEVRKLGEAGKLSANDLLSALISESNGLERFRGGAEKMNQTLRGQLSNLKDMLNVQLAASAQPLVAMLTQNMPMIVGLVGTLVSQIGPPIFTLVGGLAQTLMQLLPAIAPIVAAIANGLLMVLRAAGPALRALEPLGGQIGQAITQFATALVPIMPDLVNLLGALVMVLPDMIRLLIDVLPLIDRLVVFATGLLQYDGVRKVLATLLVVMLGYRALSGVIGTLMSFAGGLRAIAAAQGEANAAQAAGGGGAGGVGGAGGLGKLGLGVAGAGLMVSGYSSDIKHGGPTVGGVAQSAIGGAIVGGTIGSVIPGVGTVVGATAGGIIAGGVDLLSGLGDVDGNLGRSARVHALASGSTPGRSRVTSSLRNYALAGPGSGHARGTAWDVAADYPQTYAANIRTMGGYANVHDAGSGRHVHAQIGDDMPAPRGGRAATGPDGTPIIVTIENVWGQVDLERGIARGVASGYDQMRRARMERAHVDRLDAP